MAMWATPFLNFNTCRIIFAQWIIKCDFFKKYFNFILKMPSQRNWVAF